ncbi:MAG: prolipoprotein diacylglyceryl transferase family protein, partial [candidate division WOR-3 bacterium]
FIVTLILERRQLKDGVLFGIIIMLYALFRFGIDFVRYYENAANFLINQVIAIIIFIVALVFTVIQIKK